MTAWIRSCSTRSSRTSPPSSCGSAHEQLASTIIYLHADLTHKQQAIDRTKPLTTTPGRYHPSDARSPFSTASDYADPETAITPADNTFHRRSA
jgi:hypothetical protein